MKAEVLWAIEDGLKSSGFTVVTKEFTFQGNGDSGLKTGTRIEILRVLREGEGWEQCHLSLLDDSIRVTKGDSEK